MIAVSTKLVNATSPRTKQCNELARISIDEPRISRPLTSVTMTDATKPDEQQRKDHDVLVIDAAALIRRSHEDALPLVVCHGWPGSVIEQMKIVDLLTDPTAHGGSASDAFHVVIPNMPGYGFSGKPTTTGWDPARMGRAWVTLMKRLGYERFVAAGGDCGALVVDVMAGGRDAPSPLSRHRRSCSGSTPTSPGWFRPRSTRRSRPAARSRPISQPTSDAWPSTWAPRTRTRVRRS